MQTPPENNSEMFDPQKMQAIVDRLKAEGRMPTMEKLDAVLRKYRKEYQSQVRLARAKK
jgi:collagenase-like PrtC family protease